jgi:hypothetical protein
MGGEKESTEYANRYDMNKQNQPLSGPVDGMKEQMVYSARREGIQLMGSQSEKGTVLYYEATLLSYHTWHQNNLYWQK